MSYETETQQGIFINIDLSISQMKTGVIAYFWWWKTIYIVVFITDILVIDVLSIAVAVFFISNASVCDKSHHWEINEYFFYYHIYHS